VTTIDPTQGCDPTQSANEPVC